MSSPHSRLSRPNREGGGKSVNFQGRIRTKQQSLALFEGLLEGLDSLRKRPQQVAYNLQKALASVVTVERNAAFRLLR